MEKIGYELEDLLEEGFNLVDVSDEDFVRLEYAIKEFPERYTILKKGDDGLYYPYKIFEKRLVE